MSKSAVTCTIDLSSDGRHIGDLCVKWSDNTVPLGYHPVPILSLRNGDGPVAVLIAGTHGDEFEGPAALMRLTARLDCDKLTGQVILIPGLNAPALKAASRVSPLDGVNLNRGFPGSPSGSISEQIAYYVETELLPRADAVVDLHSGGKASFFAPCSLATRTADKTLFQRNLALAEAFGLPLTWVLGAFNDARSVNSAAERAGVPMIATELGGGGGVTPDIVTQAEDGLMGVLRHAGILHDQPAPTASVKRRVEITSGQHSLFAPGEGVFDRIVSAGDEVTAGQLAGHIHYVSEPRRPSEPVTFPHDGFVLAHSNRGWVTRGDMLMLVVQDVSVE